MKGNCKEVGVQWRLQQQKKNIKMNITKMKKEAKQGI
jgi:hypothetical protein